MSRYAQNKNLTRFDEGKSHEQNALGGVPIGNNNSVEEGETRQNNFIYSDRIVLDSNTVSQYNLPKSLVGKSVADATKFIDNKFKGRNDKISQSTKDIMLSKIAEAQESMKPQEPEMVPQDGMMEQSPEMMEDPSQMALGGYTKRFGGGGFAQYDTFDSNAGVGYKFNPTSTSTPTINTSDLSLSKESTTTTPDSKINMNTVGSVGMGVGTALSQVPSGALDKKYSFNNKLKAQDDSMEKVKQGVATAIPIAGLFYGIEKAGMAAGEAIGGERGRDVSTGIFDPSSGQREVLQSKDSTQFEKGVSLVAPFLSGVMAGKARKRTESKYLNKYATGINQQFSDQYALGGKIDPPVKSNSILPLRPDEREQSMERYKLLRANAISRPPTSEYKPDLRSPEQIQMDYQYLRDSAKPGFNVNSGYTPNLTDPTTAQILYNKRRNKQYALGGDTEGTLNNDELTKQLANQYFDKTSDYYKNLKLTPRNTAPIESLGLKPIGATVPYTIETQPKVDISNANRIATSGPSTLDVLKYNANKIGNTVNNNIGNLARYAPIAANAYQLAKLKKPQAERLERLGNRYKPSYVDMAQQQNIVNQELNNVNSAIQASGASQGAIRNTMLGSQLNKTKALSNAYMNAEAQNRQQDAIAQQFNLGVDQTNLQQSNTEKDINARNQGAYDTEKSKLIGKIGENIGNVGNEQAYKKIAITTTGYNWLAEYQKANPTATAEEAVTAAKKAGVIVDDAKTAKKNALGGYLIKNKVK